MIEANFILDGIEHKLKITAMRLEETELWVEYDMFLYSLLVYPDGSVTPLGDAISVSTIAALGIDGLHCISMCKGDGRWLEKWLTHTTARDFVVFAIDESTHVLLKLKYSEWM